MSRQVKKHNSEFLVFVIATLLLFSFSEVSAAAVAPKAQVSSVVHPDHVLPGSKFDVTVMVDYSDKFLADVGIWDARAGEMIRSVTLISEFTGLGNASFGFQLAAPSYEGIWNLTAITRVWWQNGWYQDPKGVMPFEVTVSDLVTLTLNTQGADSTVTLDGHEYEVGSTTPLTLQLPLGIHSVEALPMIQGQQRERYVFAGWSDGVRSNPRKNLIAHETSITALYRTEYYLSVTSDVGMVAGSGWYERGYRASFAVTSDYTINTWLGLVTYDYHFSKWSGDSSSKDNPSSVLMNAPKSVRAEFAQSGTRVDLSAAAGVLLLASILLAARGLYVHMKSRRGRIHKTVGSIRKSLIPLLVIVVVLFGFLNVAPAHAEFIFQPNASVVKIGNASWYYWNQAPSDTCILWLGGGISQETFIGYNYYWINPFEYESFGTMQFVEDLAKYYCVIALEKGGDKAPNQAGNRTIYQELYQIQSTIIADVHNWIKKQGYQHTFLVGYSVGGQAAAVEVALRDPEGWTSSDGLVLITVPLVNNVVDHAQNIRTNLLFLYGGNLPDFVTTGQKFYDNAPTEGWKGTYYYHKEFHILTDVGHEVWTVRETGAYTRRALNMVAGFVEKSKALQFAPEANRPAREVSTLNLTSVRAPEKVATGSVFVIEGNVSYSSTAHMTVALVAYDSGNNETVSATDVDLAGEGTRIVRLVIPPISNSSEQSYLVFLAEKAGDKWSRVGSPAQVVVTISDSITLTIVTSVPDATVLIDGSLHTVPASGRAEFEVSRGSHSIQVPPVIPLNTTARIVFTQWDDGTTSLQRQILVEDDIVLTAIYRKQYFVNATSPYGTVQGSGWYDEDSTATVLLQPNMMGREGVIFAYWTGDSTDSAPRTQLFVDSPKVLEAQWNSFKNADHQLSSQDLGWLLLSAVMFAFVLILNLKRPKQTS